MCECMRSCAHALLRMHARHAGRDTPSAYAHAATGTKNAARYYESSTRMHRKPHSLSTRDLRETQYFANGSRRLNDRRLNSNEQQSRADRAGPTPQAEQCLGPKWMTHVISHADARAQRARQRYTHANAHAHAAALIRALFSQGLGDCCSCCCTVNAIFVMVRHCHCL